MRLKKKIDEARMSRVILKHFESGLVILSSNRSENDAKTNNQLDKALKSDIEGAGFSYVPIMGGYVENRGTPDEVAVFEHSFIVYCYKKGGKVADFEELKDFAIRMCNKYQQESVLIYPPKKSKDNPALYNKSGQTNPKDEMDKNVKISDATEQYFSTLSRQNKKRYNNNNFSFKMKEINI